VLTSGVWGSKLEMMFPFDLAERCLGATAGEPALCIRTRLARVAEVRWGLAAGGRNIAEVGRLRGRLVISVVGFRYNDVSVVLALVIDEAARESADGEPECFGR